MLAPRADDGGGARAVVVHDVRAGQPEQAPDLLGHLLEHAARRRVAGHERGDPSQRRLLVGERALRRLCRRQRARRAGALGGHRGEEQRRDRRGRDEELRREQAVGERVANERPGVLRRVPDGEGAHDEDRRGRAAGPEAQRRPQERGEDDVRDVALGRQLGEREQDDEQDAGLDEVAAGGCRPCPRRPM